MIDPVSKNLAGIVSRGDLLRVLHRDMVSSGFDTPRLFDGKRESMKKCEESLERAVAYRRDGSTGFNLSNRRSRKSGSLCCRRVCEGFITQHPEL